MSLTYTREDFGENYPDSDVLMELIGGIISEKEISWTEGRILKVYEPLMLHKELEEDIKSYTKYMGIRIFILAHVRNGRYVTGEVFKSADLRELLFPYKLSTYVYGVSMKYLDMITNFDRCDIIYKTVESDQATVIGLSYPGFGYLLADRLHTEGIAFDDVSMFSIRNNTSTDLYFD